MIRRSLILLLIAVLALAVPVVAQNSSRPAQEVGSEVISNPSSSTALTVPDGAQWAMFSVRTAGAHFSYDGTAATTSDFYYAAGSIFLIDGNELLDGVRIINSSDGSAVVYVKYFSQR